MPKKLEQNNVIGQVEVEAKDGTLQATEHEVATTETNPESRIKIGFKMGKTENVGNFNSVRIDVSIEVPCDASEADEAFAIAKDWVDEKLGETVKQVKEMYGVK